MPYILVFNSYFFVFLLIFKNLRELINSRETGKDKLETLVPLDSILNEFYSKFEDKMKCNICEFVPKFTRKTRHNLRSHIKLKHQELYNNFIKNFLLKAELNLSDDLLNKFEESTHNIDSKSIMIKFFSLCRLPLNILENEGFKWFVKKLNPKFQLINRKTVKESLIKNAQMFKNQ